MMPVRCMYITTRSNIRSLFIEDVRDFLYENEIFPSPSIDLIGVSGLSHHFDFLISPTKAKPERLINVINQSLNSEKAKLTLFSWSDVFPIRYPTSKLFVIVHDIPEEEDPRRKKKVQTDIMAAFKKTGIHYLSWCDKDLWIKDIA